MTDTRPFNIRHCARCGQDHEQLDFKPFSQGPEIDENGTPWEYWALCPTNGEPISLTTNMPRRSQFVLADSPGLVDAINLRDWRLYLDDRQKKDVMLARIYDTERFRHGTDGHSRLVLISLLSGELDFIFDNYTLLPK